MCTVRGHPQSGGFVQCRLERFFRCGRLHFLVQKNFGLFEIYNVSARTGGERGVEQMWARERGLIFRDFMRTSFMDSP